MSQHHYDVIRDLIRFATERDIEINKITVRQSFHKLLSQDVALSCTYEGGPTKLCYGLLEIDKKPCKGCCEHG